MYIHTNLIFIFDGTPYITPASFVGNPFLAELTYDNLISYPMWPPLMNVCEEERKIERERDREGGVKRTKDILHII